MEQLIIGLTALIAGLVQGVAGFGAGIVLMMVLPGFFAVNTSAGISTSICIILNAMMVYTYRKYVNFKQIVKPAILYFIICSALMYFSTLINPVFLKKTFGMFLVILAIYFLFFNKGTSNNLSLPIKVVCIVLSAVCDGLFGIGGPLMVIYFISQLQSTLEYLGTIQFFFLINGCYNTVFRVANGIIGLQHFLVIGCGMIGILMGGQITARVVKKLNGDIIRKITYIMIGVAGVVNIIL